MKFGSNDLLISNNFLEYCSPSGLFKDSKREQPFYIKFYFTNSEIDLYFKSKLKCYDILTNNNEEIFPNLKKYRDKRFSGVILDSEKKSYAKFRFATAGDNLALNGQFYIWCDNNKEFYRLVNPDLHLLSNYLASGAKVQFCLIPRRWSKINYLVPCLNYGLEMLVVGLRIICCFSVAFNVPSIFRSKSILDTDQTCCICCDQINGNINKRYVNCPDCGNFLHTFCIEKWLLKRRDCPYCRSKVWSKWSVNH